MIDKSAPTASVAAIGFVKGPYPSFSKPVVLDCADGVPRMVKGQQAGGRALLNERVVGQLGTTLQGPVPPVAIVDLPQALIDAEPKLKHMPAGPCHANAFYDGCSEKLGVDHAALNENRVRFARLAILYGWMHANDQQLIYPNNEPRLVWSVDHGHFFGNGGPDWTPALLNARGPAEPEPWIVSSANLTQDELADAVALLAAVVAETIARAVADVPDAWGIPIEERIALAAYLAKRRDDVLGRFGYDLKEK